jgi:hypothetical protein
MTIEQAGLERMRESSLRKALSWTAWGVLLAWSIYARLVLASDYYGNYDQQSWEIALEAGKSGASPYVPGRYPYGPGWMWILLALDFLFGWTGAALHTIFRSFLAAVDLATAATIFVYCRQRGHFPRLATLLFLVNPITIFITGYHGQFDNLALLFVVLALSSWGEPDPIGRKRVLLTGGLLGVGVLVKHVILFVPLVFLMRIRGWRWRAAFMAACYAPFTLSILPYFLRDPALVYEKVFAYQAGIVEWGLRPILAEFGIVVAGASYQRGIMVVLALAALVWSLGDLRRACLLCMLGLFVFLPSFANQYTVWPVALGALDASWLYVAYLVYGGSFVWGPVSARGPEIGPSPAAPGWMEWALFTNSRALWAISAIWFAAVLVEWARSAAPTLRLHRSMFAIAAATAAVIGSVLFVYTGRPRLTLACDDTAEVWIDGEKAGSIERWDHPLSLAFPRGERVLVAVDAVNLGGPGGLIAAASARPRFARLVEPATWVCSPTADPGWSRADFDDSSWQPAPVVMAYGGGAWQRRAGTLLEGAEWVWRTVPVPEQDHMYCRWWATRPGGGGGPPIVDDPGSAARGGGA